MLRRIFYRIFFGWFESPENFENTGNPDCVSDVGTGVSDETDEENPSFRVTTSETDEENPSFRGTTSEMDEENASFRRTPSQLSAKEVMSYAPVIEDLPFRAFLLRLGAAMTDKDLESLKYLTKGYFGAAVTESLNSPTEYFDHLQTVASLSMNNIVFLQMLVWYTKQRHLYDMLVEFGEEYPAVLQMCIPNPVPVNGQRHVNIHLKGELLSKDDLEDIRSKFARIMHVPVHNIITTGIQPTGSWLITFMVPEYCSENLLTLVKQNESWFAGRGVDRLEIGVEELKISGDASHYHSPDTSLNTEAELSRLLEANNNLKQLVERLSLELRKGKDDVFRKCREWIQESVELEESVEEAAPDETSVSGGTEVSDDSGLSDKTGVSHTTELSFGAEHKRETTPSAPVSSRQTPLLEKTEQCEKAILEVQKIISGWIELENDVKQKGEQSKTEIEKEYSSAVDDLTTRKDEKLDAVKQQEEEQTSQCKASIKGLEKIAEQLQCLMETSHDLTSSSDDSQFLQDAAELTKRIDNQLAKVQRTMSKQAEIKAKFMADLKKNSIFLRHRPIIVKEDTIQKPNFKFTRTDDRELTISDGGSVVAGDDTLEWCEVWTDGCFHTGRVYWEVEVSVRPSSTPGTGSSCHTGVVREGCDLMTGEDGRDCWYMRMEYRGDQFVCESHRGGEVTTAYQHNRHSTGPQRLGVFLDCEAQTLTFIDCTNNRVMCTVRGVCVWGRGLSPAVRFYPWVGSPAVSVRLVTGDRATLPQVLL